MRTLAIAIVFAFSCTAQAQENPTRNDYWQQRQQQRLEAERLQQSKLQSEWDRQRLEADRQRQRLEWEQWKQRGHR